MVKWLLLLWLLVVVMSMVVDFVDKRLHWLLCVSCAAVCFQGGKLTVDNTGQWMVIGSRWSSALAVLIKIFVPRKV